MIFLVGVALTMNTVGCCLATKAFHIRRGVDDTGQADDERTTMFRCTRCIA